MNEDIWGLLRLPVVPETARLPAIKECLYDILQVNVHRNWARDAQRVVTLLVSHPHCKSSQLVMPCQIQDKDLRHHGLKCTLEGRGFLMTASVMFKIPDKHISDQSDVLLQAFFGNKSVLTNEDVQAEVGNVSLFTVYLYGPISPTMTLRDVVTSLCMLYYWKLEDIEVTFQTITRQTFHVTETAQVANTIALDVTTDELCGIVAKYNIALMCIASPSMFVDHTMSDV